MHMCVHACGTKRKARYFERISYANTTMGMLLAWIVRMIEDVHKMGWY